MKLEGQDRKAKRRALSSQTAHKADKRLHQQAWLSTRRHATIMLSQTLLTRILFGLMWKQQ